MHGFAKDLVRVKAHVSFARCCASLLGFGAFLLPLRLVLALARFQLIDPRVVDGGILLRLLRHGRGLGLLAALLQLPLGPAGRFLLRLLYLLWEVDLAVCRLIAGRLLLLRARAAALLRLRLPRLAALRSPRLLLQFLEGRICPDALGREPANQEDQAFVLHHHPVPNDLHDGVPKAIEGLQRHIHLIQSLAQAPPGAAQEGPQQAAH
mmetsp:Transcript_30252/g.72176  ORF Transcript_30252/g.72176 Transcript_30252/m.72176 type:complete len:208 (-) Transcript_30252:553-1176(-)